MTFEPCPTCNGGGRNPAGDPCPGCGGACVAAVVHQDGITLPAEPPPAPPSIEFFDALPPIRNWKTRALNGYLEALRANPGRWAAWPTPINEITCGHYASNINKGRQPGFARGEFEAAKRDGALYVRYLGPEHPAVGDDEQAAADHDRGRREGQ